MAGYNVITEHSNGYEMIAYLCDIGVAMGVDVCRAIALAFCANDIESVGDLTTLIEERADRGLSATDRRQVRRALRRCGQLPSLHNQVSESSPRVTDSGRRRQEAMRQAGHYSNDLHHVHAAVPSHTSSSTTLASASPPSSPPSGDSNERAPRNTAFVSQASPRTGSSSAVAAPCSPEEKTTTHPSHSPPLSSAPLFGPRLASTLPRSSATTSSSRRSASSSRYSSRVSGDLERYRNGYRGKDDDLHATLNLRFYRNEVAAMPSGAFIEDMHTTWRYDYGLLERNHGYIQWLFPIRERGMNHQSQELQLHEAQAMRADPVCRRRVLESYELILNFWGFELLDRQTGAVRPSAEHVERFENLNERSHNNLRITRVLKFLGEMGLEHFKMPFLLALTHQVFETRRLAACARSLRDYWLGTLCDDRDRERLERKVQALMEKNSNAEDSSFGKWYY